MSAEALDEGRLIKKLYLHNWRLFGYDPKNKKKRWVEKVAARGKRLVSRVRNQFEETGKQTSNIQGGNTWCH